jgi:repressor LexA
MHLLTVDALVKRHDLLIMGNAEPPGRRRPGDAPTGRQRTIIQVIETYAQQQGCAPSNRDIAERAGLVSPSSVSHHLRKLRESGWVTYEDGRPRTVRVLRSGPQATRSAGQVRRASGGTRARAGQPQRAMRREKIAWVPVVGRIAAGIPILAEQSIEAYWPLPREVVGAEEGLFMLKVAGDSMTGAGIFPGDLVVIRAIFEPPHNGDVVAAVVDGIEPEGTVKTYQKIGRRVWLMPHNSAHTPIPGDKAKFAGKVIAVLRQV